METAIAFDSLQQLPDRGWPLPPEQIVWQANPRTYAGPPQLPVCFTLIPGS